MGMRANFVDRVDDLAKLHRATASLPRREGAAVLLEGRSGIGKTALLDRFEANPGGEGSRADDYRVVRTVCRPIVGEGLSYGPIIDILIGLQRRSARRSGAVRLLRSVGRGAAQSVPEILGRLVPGVGPILEEMGKATVSAFGTVSAPLDSLDPYKRAVAQRVADCVVELARSARPAIVIIDDVQFVDMDSLYVLDLLLRRLAAEPLALVLSLTTPTAAGRAPAAVRDLAARWDREGIVRRHPMGTLSESWVAELVGRLELPAPPGFSARLTEATGGLPLLVTLCLEHWRPQDGSRIALPESVAEFVEDQLSSLDDADRDLLVLASVQGPTFVTSFLARAAGRAHDEIVERLRVLARSRVLLRKAPEDAKAVWMLEMDADVYAFDHLLLWDAAYHAQTDEQRRSRHERLARVMKEEFAAYDEAPRALMLELARHLELGGRPCLRESAEIRMALARSAAIDGLSFSEVERHGTVAIAALRRMRGDSEVRRRFVEAAEMLLSVTEVRWRGRNAPAGVPEDIDELAAEAERLAAESGEADLIARSALQRGKTLLATRGLEAALGKLGEAVELADRLGDPVRRYIATVEYGRQVSKRNLAEGLRTLREAERMYEVDARLRDTGDPVLRHAHDLAEMQFGVTLFDSGHLEEALGRLERCTRRLRDEPLNASLPIALNYLAQVRLAVGLVAEGEGTLREALEFEERRGGESGWHAYNAALLAFASSTGSQPEESLVRAEEAWVETQGTWLLNLVPIVRNLLAEVLLAQPANGSADQERRVLERAEKLAADTCVEALESGMTRSEIAALDLRARAQLRLGRSARAAELARAAVARLEEVGDMPALRTEEVFYHAACVLRADGHDAEAAALLERARQIVSGKLRGIESEPLRRAFVEDVPLNRWITRGFPGMAER